MRECTAFARLTALTVLAVLLGGTATARAVDCQREIDPLYLQTDPASLIHVDTPAEAQQLRAEIVDLIWSGQGFPTGMPNQVHLDADPPAGVDPAGLPNLDRIDAYRFLVNSFVLWGHHFHPSQGNGRLALLHQGHMETLPESRLGDMLAFLLEEGFSVITFLMPGYGPNTGPVDSDHKLYEGLASPSFEPLRVFLEPVALGLNQALASQSYSDVTMVGHSGGGWTTTVYAAIDPRVTTSFPVAGSLPLYLHEGECGIDADFEQVRELLYGQIASYLELYVLGAHGSGREQHQVLNQFDGCCFWGITYQTYESEVASRVQALGPGHYAVISDPTRGGWHELTLNAQVAILRALGKPLWVVDDDYPTASIFGIWTPFGGSGYADGHRRSSGPGSARVRFDFPPLPPGIYRVSATWQAWSGLAPDAPFEIFRDGISQGVVPVDQRAAPADYVSQGTAWRVLGSLPVPDGTLRVEVATPGASGPVAADAVRVDYVDVVPYEGPQDPDGDGVPADGSGSGIAGDHPCTAGQVSACDDNCPTLPNGLQLDADADGVGDACDACVGAADASQLDSDDDGFGNICDGDFDQTGTVTIADLLRMVQAFGSMVGGAGYDETVDMNGSGSINILDLMRLREQFGQPPGPSAWACAGTAPCP